ncbi:DUF1284 domain-containing protein [Anaeromassilibacillus senegalensis]|uniref:DUF1284 domain-containing protein n=1 Tax=Anaeromassilibacillus senegalensis TaxID=1673717 RepID=UPI0006803998|nr:DUF1284 domain-containing protein [Anaeromassilibacillus senegalensis]
MEERMTLRPHHGLCIRHFTGKGYSPGFVENMARVITQLHDTPEQEICLRMREDILCGNCPHNEPGGCTSGQKVRRYDAAVLALCGLEDGAVLTWGEFERLVEERILSAGLLETVCRGCQWLALCQSIYSPKSNFADN